MHLINLFPKDNAYAKLLPLIDEYYRNAYYALYADFESVVVSLPICARAPLLALYFANRENLRQRNFDVLVRLFQIAVRIYERHVLYDKPEERSAAIDRFVGSDILQLINSINSRIQTNRFKLDSVIDNHPYYKEVAFDLKQCTFCSAMPSILLDYCVMKVMQIVALYAGDVLLFLNNSAKSCEELEYKKWRNIHNTSSNMQSFSCLFFPNNLTEDNYEEFCKNYSLR